jgi:transposase
MGRPCDPIYGGVSDADLASLRFVDLLELARRQTRQIEALTTRVAALEKLLEEARRAGKRQAAPFSKGEPKPDPKRPGRKAGAAHGPSAFRPPPDHVDEVHDAPLPPACPDCGGHLVEERVAPQFQTEIPRVRPLVRRFDIHVGACACCGKRTQGRHPLQTSDALGAAASQLGPNALALAAYLNKVGGMPYGKVQAFFMAAFQLRFSCGGLARALHRTADKCEPTYQGFLLELRQSPVVYPDETSMRVSGLRGWLWVFVTDRITVYVQRMSRGTDVLEEILGLEFAGRLVHDGWAPYDQLENATHQQCLAHYLRRARELLETATKGAVRFPRAVKLLLQDGLALRDRYEAGDVSQHGRAVALGRLEGRLDRLLEANITHEGNRRFQAHLERHRDEMFTFLRHDGVEATSWPADHATRPAVLFRKVSGGHRSHRGAHTHDVLTSIHRTCAQNAADVIAFLITALCAPKPRILDIHQGVPAPPQQLPENVGLRRSTPARRRRAKSRAA